MVIKHSQVINADKNKGKNINVEGSNINVGGSNINVGGSNINVGGSNINVDINIDDTSCIKCLKNFSSVKTLNRHKKICKGVSNTLECHLCHKVFTTPQGKSQHLKKCTISKESNTIIDQSQNAEVINNTTNNTTNNTINGNVNIQNTIVMYNDQNIEFKDDHITKRDLKKIFNGASVQTIQAISTYALKLLENIDNLCIRKKHLTNSYCEVHVGNGEWKTRPEQSVLERFSQDVAISANDKLYEHPQIGTKMVRDEITELVSNPEDVHSQTIKLRRELRSVIIDKTKIQSSNDTMEENM
jgi:hypothetical protein